MINYSYFLVRNYISRPMNSNTTLTSGFLNSLSLFCCVELWLAGDELWPVDSPPSSSSSAIVSVALCIICSSCWCSSSDDAVSFVSTLYGSNTHRF